MATWQESKFNSENIIKVIVDSVTDEEYEVFGEGTNDGEFTHCHLASRTRGRYEHNGWCPTQIHTEIHNSRLEPLNDHPVTGRYVVTYKDNT